CRMAQQQQQQAAASSAGEKKSDDASATAMQTGTEGSSPAAATAEQGQECPICLYLPENPVLSECGHIYCRECIQPMFNERGFSKCALCRTVICEANLMAVPRFAVGWLLKRGSSGDNAGPTRFVAWISRRSGD